MLRIIVVDDEAPTREWFIYCIKKMSDEFEVVGSAANGNEALKLIAGLKPDVVITDIRMPGMDGIELMEAVKKSYPYIDFVILTSFAEFDYARAAIKYGAAEYLLKTEIKQNDVVMILQTLAKKRHNTEKSKDDVIVKEKEEIIEKIITGIYNSKMLQEYGCKLGLKENTSYFVIVVRESNYNLVNPNLEAALARYLYLDIYRFSKEHKLFILVRVITDGKELAIETCIKELLIEISEKTTRSIGISDKHHSINSLNSAFKEAILALDNDFYAGRGSVNFFSKLSGAVNLDLSLINSLFKCFLDSMNYFQGEHLLEYSDKIFKLLENGTVRDMDFAKKICRSMIILLEEKAGLLERDGDYGIFKEMDFIDISCYRSHIENMIVNLYKEDSKNYALSVANALKYIENNYYKQISLSAIAKHVHLSSEYFSRLFKHETGQNYSLFLMMYRLKRAKELLDSTDLKISEIAERVGIPNISYFSQIYKKYMGQNATTDRNRMLQ